MQKFLQLALHLVTLAKIISGEFTNPGKQGETLILGQSLRITYRGIDYQNYTIALWQQSPTGGSASLGPAIFQTTDSRSNSFDWVVQVYNFDLTYSNNFFFWLFQGDYSNQGHPKDAKNMVSGYFFISYAETSASTSSSSSASATTTATSISATTPAISQPSSSSTPPSSQGLSTGAKAGIAVSAAAGGLAIVGAVVFFTRYRSQKNTELQQAIAIGGGSQFFPTPYTSPLPPGAEMYYKSHGREMYEQVDRRKLRLEVVFRQCRIAARGTLQAGTFVNNFTDALC
ncbi:hypothetical protein LMH87_002967 [Akanthomyces muscarius]|uniref:Uncharacterized protein n=1 Tax=Akanthomyces muscarius TaxID=2231603 RepID=A0A9W8Q7D8_AKAMU|nr:hypothetical protein LMH87_002967 [Akanthomyces muscarius]KAJ4148502.1 hypothetical protein LMH87_002967 [Akanthomyces muscarius]